MSKKRLVYIMENLQETDTKNKNIVFFCNYFKKRGLDVTFLTTLNEQNKNIEKFADNVPIVKLSRDPSIKKGQKPLLFPFFYLLKKRKDYDIIWCYLNMPSSFYGALMKKFFGKKLMIKCDMAYPTKNKNIFKAIWKYYTVNFPLANADFVLTESKEVYDGVMKIKPKASVSIIPNGVPVSDFEKAEKEIGDVKKENIVLSVGRLEPYKGNREAILAFSKFHKNNQNWRLVIVGPPTDKKYFEELKALAKKTFPDYEKTKVVEFTGSKFGNDLFSTMKKAKIFCVASYKRDRGDSFNNALPQAMFFGAHPVVTDAGQLWTQVEGLPVRIVKSEDADDMAQAFEEAKNRQINPKVLREYIRKNFNWDINLKKINIP